MRRKLTTYDITCSANEGDKNSFLTLDGHWIVMHKNIRTITKARRIFALNGIACWRIRSGNDFYSTERIWR